MADQPTGALNAFWRTLTKVDHSKINSNWIALRNSAAVALPLAIGIALHNPLGAVAVTTGALNVSYSDGTDPYKRRAKRMFIWTALGAIAVFIGSVTGHISWLAVVMAAVWAFIGGLCYSISTKTGDLGLNTLVALMVFAARGAMDLEGAAKAGALVFAGGLLQMLFALIFWPLHKDEPERRVLGSVYSNLATELQSSSQDVLDLQLKSPSQSVQDTLDALGQDHSVESERFRMLFDQVDRLRMSSFVLLRLRSELAPQDSAATAINECIALGSQLLASVGDCLTTSRCITEESELLARLEQLLRLSRMAGREVASALDIFGGQLRVVVQLAGHTTIQGAEQFGKREAVLPWRLRVTNWIGTLVANLHPSSTFFRHAVRVAVCVAIADSLGRMVSWQRSYWLPMTVAVVLKPDFATTFSRGVLRLTGTFFGLLLATVLYHLLPVSSPSDLAISQLILVGLYTFAMRSIGPANYGVFSVAISGLIVFLVAATGVPPFTVVAERALNTSLGGVFALIAYALWPTWEHTRAGDVMAAMLDAARAYFHEIATRFTAQTETEESDLDPFRREWRRTRSNAEATVDHLSSEPGTKPSAVACLTSVLASSFALVHAMMGLEAMLVQRRQNIVPEAFQAFSHDVEFTLYYLSAALRGSQSASGTLPELREDHRRLTDSLQHVSPDDDLLLMDTDRLTVSLNTLREQVMRYLGKPA